MINPQDYTQISIRLKRILPSGSRNRLLWRRAIVTDAIHPNQTGRVKFRGTWWNALCEQDIVLAAGITVYVIDLDSSTLIVEPILEPIVQPIPMRASEQNQLSKIKFHIQQCISITENFWRIFYG